MSVYFLRHIRTLNNSSGIISGRAEAEILPDQKLLCGDYIPRRFDAVFCSVSERCRRTAALLPSNSYDGITFTEELLERDVGVLEGVSRNEAVLRFPELFNGKKLRVDAPIPKGETLEDVAARLRDIAEYLRKTEPRQDILICSHNQTLKVLFSMLKNIPLTDQYWQSCNFENGRIIRINDIAY